MIDSSAIRILWCASYLLRSPRMMLTVSSILGGWTWIGWNRRSSAPSFSMYFRYSSSVVAPMHWISPRARGRFQHAGGVDGALGRAGPHERVQFVDEEDHVVRLTISFITTFSRSSNWPRYFVPAMSDPRSSATIRRL